MSDKSTKSLDKIIETLNSESLVIDCGANVGNITAKMARKGAFVYAFEPNPHAFKKLSARFQGCERVTCLQKGVLNKNCTMKLFLHKNSDEDEVYWASGSSLLEFKGNIRTDKFVEIEIINIIEFIKNLNRKIDILKIDVEGAECEILPDLINGELYKNISIIAVETHDDKIPELKEKTNRIKKLIAEKNIENIRLDWV